MMEEKLALLDPRMFSWIMKEDGKLKLTKDASKMMTFDSRKQLDLFMNAHIGEIEKCGVLVIQNIFVAKK